ncbi:MAG: TonB-dependent receptor [Deltaproteobacteria bacterium]|nr:TonB-dependent receptor [Candidatus Anaeroferrophillus wilburensis]MBN2887826.1 TonB-dependent receptor [Deltaproteobacteria bacterium]
MLGNWLDRRRGIVVLASIVLVFMAVMPGYGVEPPQKMDEIVVTASRVEEPLRDVAGKVEIIDAEDILHSSAAYVDELLVEQGIGHIHKYPGNLSRVEVRGFLSPMSSEGFSSNILFLVDGRRAGTVNMAKIPVTNVERIEIIKGSASAVYGSEAMGGVINIITRKGKGSPSGSVGGTLGSDRLVRGTAELQGEYKGFDFFVSGARESRDDYKTADDGDYANTAYDSQELNVTLGYTFLDHHRLGMSYSKVDNWDIGNPGPFERIAADQYSEKNLESIDVSYDGAAPDKGLAWKLRYYDVASDDYFTYPSWDYGYYRTEREIDSDGLQLQGSWQGRYQRLTLGADWDEQEVVNRQIPSGTPYNVNGEYEDLGIYVEDKIFLWQEKILISLGLRYDNYDLQTAGTQGYDTLTTKSETLDVWCPRFGIVYRLTNDLRMRAAAGKGYHIPSASQMASDFYSTGWYQDGDGNWQTYSVHYLGDSGLDPEKNWNYEAGIDFAKKGLYLSANVFYIDYDDKIIDDAYVDPDTGESISTYKNTTGALIRGIEGEASWDLGAWFDWQWQVEPFAAFVYLDEYKDLESRENLRYVSEKSGRLGLRLADNHGFRSQLQLVYHGPHFMQDWNVYPVAVVEKGGFTVASFTVGKHFSLPSSYVKGLELTAAIDNLFDRNYSFINGYPMAGRSYKAGVRFNF